MMLLQMLKDIGRRPLFHVTVIVLITLYFTFTCILEAQLEDSQKKLESIATLTRFGSWHWLRQSEDGNSAEQGQTEKAEDRFKQFFLSLRKEFEGNSVLVASAPFSIQVPGSPYLSRFLVDEGFTRRFLPEAYSSIRASTASSDQSIPLIASPHAGLSIGQRIELTGPPNSAGEPLRRTGIVQAVLPPDFYWFQRMDLRESPHQVLMYLNSPTMLDLLEASPYYVGRCLVDGFILQSASGIPLVAAASRLALEYQLPPAAWSTIHLDKIDQNSYRQWVQVQDQARWLLAAIMAAFLYTLGISLLFFVESNQKEWAIRCLAGASTQSLGWLFVLNVAAMILVAGVVAVSITALLKFSISSTAILQLALLSVASVFLISGFSFYSIRKKGVAGLLVRRE